MHEFTEQAGSLRQIIFLDGLECVEDTERLTGKSFGGDVVAGPHSLAPKASRKRGSWHAELRSIIVQLTCAYRLGRSANLLEVFYPLHVSREECKHLETHHSHWSVNLKYSVGDLDLQAKDETSATDADLMGEKSHALRFAVKRSRIFNPNIAPVTAVGFGIRDAGEYGSLQLDSLDTKCFSHSRIGTVIFEKVMGNDPCGEVVIKTIGTLEEMVQDARNLREKAAAQRSGAIGASIKERKRRAVMLDQTPEERGKTMDIFITAVDKNGCRRLMDAVKKRDPEFVKWGEERLARAKK